jgi:hypothetical protein
MAFTNLYAIPQAQWQALNPSFQQPPTRSTSGTPDNRITIVMGGWASGTTQTLAFTVTAATGVSASLSVESANPDTIAIQIMNTGSSGPATLYWTVDVGSDDSKATDWSVNFDIQVGNRSSGKWIFRKGGSGDPS